jgi:hypothetical protein
VADSNLTIQISADASKLRADLAVAQATVRNFSTDVRKLAADVQAGVGDPAGLQKLTSGLIQAEAQVKSLKSTISSAGASAGSPFESLIASIERIAPGAVGAAGALTGLSGALTRFAPIAAAAFAIEEIRNWNLEVANAAEKATITAAAIGTTPEKFALLGEAMKLAGGDAEAITRSMQILAQRAEEGLQKPMEAAREAFEKLHVSGQDLAEGLKDPTTLLAKLADGFKALNDEGRRGEAVTALREIAGRGNVNLIASIMGGPGELAAYIQRVKELGAAMDAELIAKGKASAGLTREADAAWKGVKDRIYEANQPLNDFATTIETKVLVGVESLLDGFTALDKATRGWLSTGAFFAPLWFPVGAAVGAMTGSAAKSEGTGTAGGAGGMKAWLDAHGYSPTAAAGVMGNASVESGFDPNAGLGTAHQGLFQWDASRWGNATAAAGGKTPNFLQQMEFMDAELAKLDPAFKTAGASAGELAARFEKIFERSGGQMSAQRIQRAESYASGGAGTPEIQRSSADEEKAYFAKLDLLMHLQQEKAKTGDKEAFDAWVDLNNRKIQLQAQLAGQDVAEQQKARDFIKANAPTQGAAEIKGAQEIFDAKREFAQQDFQAKAALLDQEEAKLRAQGQSTVGIEQQKFQLVLQNAESSAAARINAETRVQEAQTETARLSFTLAEEAAATQQKANDDTLKGVKARVDAQVAGRGQGGQDFAGTPFFEGVSKQAPVTTAAGVQVKTQAQGIQAEYDATIQLAGAEKAALANLMAMADATGNNIEQTKVYWQQWELGIKTQTQVVELQKQMADQAKQAADAFAKPFQQAFNSIGSSMESAISGLLLKTETRAKAFKEIYQSSVKAGIDLAGSVLSKVGGGLLGGAAGEGIGDVIGKQVSGWVSKGLGTLIPGLATQTTVDTTGATASAPILAGGIVSGATAAAPILAAAIGGTGAAAVGGAGVAVGAGAGIAAGAGVGVAAGAGTAVAGGVATAAATTPEIGLLTTANTLLSTIEASIVAMNASLDTLVTVDTIGFATLATGSATGGAASGTGSIIGGLAIAAAVVPKALGGIVPAAAGGWVVPAAAGGWQLPASKFGTDSVMTALTPGEMVLPKHLSEGFQKLFGGGGGPGGGDLHVHVAPGATILDGPSFNRWFIDQGGKRMITDQVKAAVRSGALTMRNVSS